MTRRQLPAIGRVAGCVLPSAIVIAFVWLSFGPDWNPRVPIVAGGDGLFYLAQSKSTVDHGWWWHDPSLGLPGEYPPLIFGQTTNVDQALVWVAARFTHDVGLAVNLTWIGMLGLSALTATWGLRRLGASPLSAGAAAILFALSPFALSRNIGHFSLVTYLVPFPATAALLLASASPDAGWRRKDVAVLAGGCVLTGFNYIYNAFFGAAIVAAGLVAGFARTRRAALLKVGGACFGALVVATLLNLIPTQLAWREYGQPSGTQHLPMESEVFGLKIRYMVSPVLGHWFPPFRAWLDRDARAEFPDESEVRISRLGTVATAGWLALMASLVLARRRTDPSGDVVPAAGGLAVVAILIATIGGFGSLFSLISTDIRAYNRILPFIAFFALTGLALWIDRLVRSPRVRILLWMVIVLFGVADQRLPLARLAAGAPGVAADWQRVRDFVAELEARLPDRAMVYQLPIRPYPSDSGVERMGVYAHFRPYLVSHQLRWSYPALSPGQQEFERNLQQRPEREWAAVLAQAGFAAVLIDRAGYADRGGKMAAELRAAGPHVTTLAENASYLALSIRPQ